MKGTRSIMVLLLGLLLCIGIFACGEGPSGEAGATGAAGEAGDSGLNSLVSVTDEPAGANCEYGGKKIEGGIDTNKNGLLDTGELDGTEYICNGSSGLLALINTTAADIVNCPYGGVKIEVGLDADKDNLLDADEVNEASTSYFCTPAGSFYTIGGAVSGLEGTLILRKNGYEDITITSDGAFAFPTPLISGAGYDISIITKPPGQVCEMANGSGTVSGSNVTDVTVNCITFGPRYSAAPDWNDYVRASDINTACDGTETGGYSACIHGGEMRALEVEGKSTCAALTASDALGAFNWTCDSSTNPVKMVSTGLKANKNLSDLIDFDAAAWKPNSVTVNDGAAEYLTTPSRVWWANPVEVDDDGGALSTAGEIYIVNAAAPTAKYTVNASKVALVIKPGVTLQGTSTTGETIISADTRNFLWIEGTVNATGDNIGVYLNSVKFSALRNVEASGANTGSNLTGVYLYSSDNNTLSNVTASNNGNYGIVLSYSTSNTLSNVTASNNGYGVYLYWYSNNNTLLNVTASNNYQYGVYLDSDASNNTLLNVTASNNGNYGIVLSYSTSNTFSNVTASNNGTGGVDISDSDNNTFLNVTASNNGAGVLLKYSDNNTLLNVAASNNTNYGIYLSYSDNNTLLNIAASNNIVGVVIAWSSNNKFTELLKVGTNTAVDCSVSGGTDPGLVHGSCSTSGLYNSGGPGGYGITNSSDAAFYNGVTFASSFVGKAIANDVSNQSDVDGGAAAYPSTPATFDWANFDNPYRGWGKDGNAFPDSTNQGRWTSGAGRIWDWSLKLGDLGDLGPNGTLDTTDDTPAILGILSVPTGDDTLTHTWYVSPTPTSQTSCDTAVPGSTFDIDHCETTYLRKAVESQNDGSGNDNDLCESGETCLYTPNIGSYQGHGSLIDETVDGTLTFTDGTLTGITLMKYGTNGR